MQTYYMLYDEAASKPLGYYYTLELAQEYMAIKGSSDHRLTIIELQCDNPDELHYLQ